MHQRQSLTEYTNDLIRRETPKTDMNEVQSEIHPDINFMRNSVNLLVGKRGSGKTFNVFREITKLCTLGNREYSQLIYITDSNSDDTFYRFKRLMTIPVRICKYVDAVECLNDVIDAKAAYMEIQQTNLQDLITDDTRYDVLNTLEVKDFSRKFVHTLVLLDDCINVLKSDKHQLNRLIFKNRRPKLTFFLCIQDTTGISTQIKANVNSFWLFGGFNKLKFNLGFYQVNSPIDREQLWEKY
jgi:hypothetical protein